jgi:hypothetical protein
LKDDGGFGLPEANGAAAQFMNAKPSLTDGEKIKTGNAN